MVSRITEIKTNDGEITLGDLIRFLLSTPEFKVKQLSDTFLSLTDHVHDVDALTGAEKLVKQEQLEKALNEFDSAVADALNALEGRINVPYLLSQIKELKEKPDFDPSKIEKRLRELENRKPEAPKTTVIQNYDKDRIARVEARQSEILGIISNIIDNNDVKIDDLRKEIVAELSKVAKTKGKHANIIGGVGGVNKLKLLFDVNVEGVANGQTLVWNAATQKWEAGSVSGSAVWGAITGTLSNQTDLQAALDTKIESVVEGTNISVDNTDPLNPIVTSLADRYKTTSSTSQTIVSTGTLTFTVSANLSYTPLQEVIIAFDSSNHMHGTVTSYSGTTLVVSIKGKTGSGTYSSWTINLDGTPVDALTGSGTANQIAYFTGAQTLASLTTATYPSLTELSYVKGVTSAIQTQINSKANTSALASYVPYSGATGNVSLGAHSLTATSVTAGTLQTDGYLNMYDTIVGAMGSILLNSGVMTFESATTIPSTMRFGTIQDTSSYNSIDPINRVLFDELGNTVAEWGGTTAYGFKVNALETDNIFNVSSSYVSFGSAGDVPIATTYIYGQGAAFGIDVTNRYLQDSTGVSAIDWNARYGYDASTFLALDWGNRNLLDTSAVASVDWSNRLLYSNSGTQSLDWFNRYLLANDGSTIMLDWSTAGAASFGSNTVSASSFIGNLSGNAGTATTLFVTRTLWGQSFNGGANVTGSLTSVGDITGGANNMIITAGTGASRTLTLRTTTSGSTATDALFINASQNVGIGTTSQANRLHVYTTTSADGISLDGTTNPCLILRTSGTIRGYSPCIATNAGAFFTDAQISDLCYRVEGASNRILFGQGAGASALSIQTAQVGVNTYSPSATFQVNGTVTSRVTAINRAVASQTANIYEAQNSGGTVLASISASGGVTAATVTSNGLVNISGASAGQIQFPAAQNASANANTLDDYEEGTWTPTLTFATAGDLSVSYTNRLGTYRKIGGWVHVTCDIITSTFTHTTASGNCNITGFPFTSAASSLNLGACQWQGITRVNYTDINALVTASSNAATLSACGSGQSVVNIATGDMPTGGTVRVRFAMSYPV